MLKATTKFRVAMEVRRMENDREPQTQLKSKMITQVIIRV